MHPPTPYPASARTKSRTRDTAFREITARANALSKSEQDFASVMKKAEEVAGKLSKTPNASRRYSVASKFAGPKTDNTNAVSNDITPGGAKPKLNKRNSFASLPQSNGGSTPASLPTGKNAAAASKTLTTKPAVPSLLATSLAPLPKRQPIVPEQAIKLHKSTSDLRKKTVFVHEKAESTRTTHTNKAKGMLLKSARYWLGQVKLAEVMDKHGVSVGFFQLALECEAEPVELLREELISYIKRHSLWFNAIQQVLLSYGVTNEVQHALFSQLSASSITETSVPCTLAKELEGTLSNDKDPADQIPEKSPKCSGANFDSTMPKETVEESNLKKGDLHSQKIPMLDASGQIESMDADSVTREVVSYIMSSMNYPDSLENLKNYVLGGPKESYMLASSDQSNQSSSVLSEAGNSVLLARKSMWTPKPSNPKEAVPQESSPSLNAWNTLYKEVGIGKLDVQEEVSIKLDNCMSDSVSTEKGTGEEMCVSMELDVDETASDNLSDLQSKSPTFQRNSSEESNCHKAQKTDETHGNVVKALDVNRSTDEAISADQNIEESSKNSIYKKSHDKVFEAVQISEKCESGSDEGLKLDNANPDTETKKCTEVQINCLPESEGNIRSSSRFGGRSQTGKEKSSPKKAEAPALKKYNGAASALQNSRRLSTSTPKSLTSACGPNIEAGSRTGRKSRVSQLTEPGIESNLTTPSQEVRDGSKQVSLNNLEGMDGAMGSMATPGSAGVRRSARLLRTLGGTTMSTPGSVSTHVQRKLGTPIKVENDMM